jgi:hypothetical protein
MGNGRYLISDGILHIILISHWCDIIVLNVHIPSEGKSGDTKDGY